MKKLVAVAIAGMFGGAHILFFIVNLPTFGEVYGPSIISVQTFINAVFSASSGMVFYGGLYGAVLGVVIYTHKVHIDHRMILNIASCGYPILHAFGRIGCTLGGCCYGVEYHGICAIQYTEAHINPGISDHIADFPRFPVQPLEALLEFAIAAVLIVLFIRTRTRYSLIAIYLFVYGIIRFSDEFLRGDAVRGLWGPFSTSQWIALGSVIGVSIYWTAGHFKRSDSSANC